MTASGATPASSSASSARASSRFVSPPLKRETTTATERRSPARRALEHGVAVRDLDLARDVLDDCALVGDVLDHGRGLGLGPAPNGSAVLGRLVSAGWASTAGLGRLRSRRAAPRRRLRRRQGATSCVSSGSPGSGATNSSYSLVARRSSSLGLRLPVEAAQVLVVQPVAELIPLGGQIAPVLVVRRDLDRHLLDHRQPEAVDARSASSGCS